MFHYVPYDGAFLGPRPTRPAVLRSPSAGPANNMPPPRSTVSKARSIASLRTMATFAHDHDHDHDSSFHTIQDPRTASTSDLSRTGSISSQPADTKKDEIAVLSDKLISAINHQQTLDDNLAHARHELENERARVAELEAKFEDYEARIARGELMTRDAVSKHNTKLNADLDEANRQKDSIAQEKKKIEAELENLTSSLFEEANKMVATANEQRENTEKKNLQLRDQIRDGETVIASQMEQLAELKSLMQSSDYRKDLADSPRVSNAPSSPTVVKDDQHIWRLLEAMNLSPITQDRLEVAPSPSTQLVHLVRPQCRTDIPCYDDFKNLIQTSGPRSHNPSHAPSRAGSGSYGGLSGLGLTSLSHGNSSNSNLAASQDAKSAANSKAAAPSPSTPGSFSPSDNKGPVHLKDTRFFKRILLEDIEPTLRLDLSPSLSWLQRRSILSAIADSTLVVEPIPEASQRLYGKYTSCSVCGENRKEGENPRTHAMRSKDNEAASKWAVCTLCLEKVRAVGDLIGYTRMVRDGVVKIADLKDEEEAWEEIIRLRERLFWARLAGGVVPAFLPSAKQSPVATRPTPRPQGGPDPNSPDQPSKENTTPGFQTPDQSRRTSEENPPSDPQDAEKADQEAQLQLQAGLDESLTTFDNARQKAMQNAERAASSVPSSPATPSRKRQSGNGGSFPKINIPRIPAIPATFWEQQVNTLS